MCPASASLCMMCVAGIAGPTGNSNNLQGQEFRLNPRLFASVIKRRECPCLGDDVHPHTKLAILIQEARLRRPQG